VADLDAPLALLEQHEAIRRVEGAHKGPGRKPGPTYEVNPSFSNSQNPQN
jgi:hypothetical protein